MAYRRVIYISNTELTVYRVGKTEIQKDLIINDPETGNDAFLDYLQQIDKKPISILVDILEEEFHLEPLPHLGRNDRNALILRKQKQLVHGAHFALNKVLHRQRTGRRDDRILFMAIRNEDILLPWLKSLDLAKIPIAGIFSVPLMYEKILKFFPNTEEMLLVTAMPSQYQGKFLVRQSYFNRHQLVLSRLNQLSVQNPDDIAQEMAGEVDRMRRYLVRAYKLGNDQIFKTHFIAPEELLNALQGQQSASLRFGQGDHSEFHSVSSIGTKLGLSLPSGTPISILVSFWLGQKRLLKSHYKDNSTVFYFYHYLAKQLMYVASALMLLGGVSYASACLINAKNTGIEAEQLKYDIGQFEQRLQQVPRVESVKGYSPIQIENMVKTAENITQQIVIPTALLEPISQVLNRYPTVMIKSIEWGDGEESEPNGDQAFLNPLDMANGLDPDNGGVLKNNVVQTRILGEIVPFDGDYRHAHLLINRLVNDLRTESSIRSAKATRFPIDLSHQAKISGEMGVGLNASLKTNFTVDLEIDRK